MKNTFDYNSLEQRIIEYAEKEIIPLMVACPFNFLIEFDLWFEWKRHIHFEKENPLSISEKPHPVYFLCTEGNFTPLI